MTIKRSLATSRPALLLIADPADYVNTSRLTFVVGDPAWD